MNKKIEINASNEYHVLRHFQHVSKTYIQTLIGKKYSYFDFSDGKVKERIVDQDAIDEALQSQGTKFFPNIKGLSIPRELLQLIIKEFESLQPSDIKWKSKPNKR